MDTLMLIGTVTAIAGAAASLMVWILPTDSTR